MFGFGKKKAAGEFLAATGLWGAFDEMQQECPGAAYIFARTMYNGQAIVNSRTPEANKRQTLDRAIAEAVPHARADGGVSILAMRAMRQAAAARDPAARTTFFETFAAIARHGRTYRELEDRDFLTPPDPEDDNLINGMGADCLGGVVEILERDGEASGQKPAEIQESIDTIVATYDIRGEIRSGLLPVHIRHVEMILALGSAR
jgi:hypothetical protein